jgi:hypothetical protein
MAGKIDNHLISGNVAVSARQCKEIQVVSEQASMGYSKDTWNKAGFREAQAMRSPDIDGPGSS